MLTYASPDSEKIVISYLKDPRDKTSLVNLPVEMNDPLYIALLVKSHGLFIGNQIQIQESITNIKKT